MSEFRLPSREWAIVKRRMQHLLHPSNIRVMSERDASCLYVLTVAEDERKHCRVVCKYARDGNLRELDTVQQLRLEHTLLPVTFYSELFFQPSLDRHVSLIVRPLYGDNFDIVCQHHDFSETALLSLLSSLDDMLGYLRSRRVHLTDLHTSNFVFTNVTAHCSGYDREIVARRFVHVDMSLAAPGRSSRCDDLEALVHFVCTMAIGELPWMKKNMTAKEICAARHHFQPSRFINEYRVDARMNKLCVRLDKLAAQNATTKHRRRWFDPLGLFT